MADFVVAGDIVNRGEVFYCKYWEHELHKRMGKRLGPPFRGELEPTSLASEVDPSPTRSCPTPNARVSAHQIHHRSVGRTAEIKRQDSSKSFRKWNFWVHSISIWCQDENPTGSSPRGARNIGTTFHSAALCGMLGTSGTSKWKHGLNLRT